MKTRFVTSQECEKNRRWLHVDADDKVLGRMAVRIAMVLMGKELVRNPEVAMQFGLMVIWSGIVLITVLNTAIFWRLSRW